MAVALAELGADYKEVRDVEETPTVRPPCHSRLLNLLLDNAKLIGVLVISVASLVANASVQASS